MLVYLRVTRPWVPNTYGSQEDEGFFTPISGCRSWRMGSQDVSSSVFFFWPMVRSLVKVPEIPGVDNPPLPSKSPFMVYINVGGTNYLRQSWGAHPPSMEGGRLSQRDLIDVWIWLPEGRYNFQDSPTFLVGDS